MVHHSDQRIETRQRLSQLFQYLRCHYGPSIRDQLEIKKSQWNRLISNLPVDINVLDFHLSQLGLNRLTLQQKHFEPSLVISYLEGQRNYLPSYYAIGAFSNKKIGVSLLDIIDKHYGENIKVNLLKSLQVGEDFFNITTNQERVSTILYSHMYEYLRSQVGIKESDLYWIGQKTTMTDLNPHWRERYHGHSLNRAYADYLEQISLHVEQSYQYELYRLSSKEVIFRKRPNPVMQDVLHSSLYGNHESCVYSLGFTSSVGYYANGLFPVAKKTRCLYQGEAFSEFHVDLTNFNPPSYFAK